MGLTSLARTVKHTEIVPLRLLLQNHGSCVWESWKSMPLHAYYIILIKTSCEFLVLGIATNWASGNCIVKQCHLPFACIIFEEQLGLGVYPIHKNKLWNFSFVHCHQLGIGVFKEKGTRVLHKYSHVSFWIQWHNVTLLSKVIDVSHIHYHWVTLTTSKTGPKGNRSLQAGHTVTELFNITFYG